MPRPMPVSKYEAERDMLYVTMHWYWFQMLTMRSSFSSVDSTVYEPSKWSQYALSLANSASAFSLVSKRASSAEGRSLVDDALGLPLLVLGVLEVAEREREGLRLAGREGHLEAVRTDGVPAGRHGVG